jgi:hypothetical phagelike protein
MTIGERIKLKRKELGITVDDLAVRLNKNRATVYRYESNEIEKLPTTVLEPLAKALNTTPAYLMGWNENTELIERSITNLENIILDKFDHLNDDGQSKLMERLDELLELPKYRKD